MSKAKLGDVISPHFFRNSALLIVLAVTLLYANTIQHGFVLDDVAVVEQNQFVKQGVHGIPAIMTSFYWQGYWNSNAGLYRPLSLVSFAVEYQLFPGSPFIHHFFNVVYYALCCVLLLKVLRLVFPLADARMLLFACLLFAVHPAHTEVVANIKSRDELFSLLFFLISLLVLYRAAQRNWKVDLLVAGCFLLSLLSKEGALVFLPVVFLIDASRGMNLLDMIRLRWSFVAVALVWLLWHQYVISSSGGVPLVYSYADNSLLSSSSIIVQKATAFAIFARYIIKLLVPYQLSYDYSFNEIPLVDFTNPLALMGLFLFLALLFWAWKERNNKLLVRFGIAWILLPLLFTGNFFFMIGATMADRFLFVPSLGSCLLFSGYLFQYLKQESTVKKIRLPLLALSGLVLLAYSVRTFSRNKDWKSNEVLFRKDVSTVPNSAKVHYNYALVLQQMNNGSRLDEARAEYEKCLKIDSLYRDALINLGVIYTKQQHYDAALSVTRRAGKLNPDDVTVLGNIGDVYFKKGQTDSALVYFREAEAKGYATAGFYNELGTSYFSLQRYAEADTAFTKGLALDDKNWELYMNYGNVLAVTKRFPEALKAFQHSYALNANNAQTLYYLALTYVQLGDTLTANKYYASYQQMKGHE